MKYYLSRQYAFFIVFGAIVLFGCVILLIASPYALKDSFCRGFKRDLTRRDYKKHEKIVPGLCFIMFSCITLLITGILFDETYKVETRFETAMCRQVKIVHTFNWGAENGTWIGVQNLTNRVLQFNDNYAAGFNLFQNLTKVNQPHNSASYNSTSNQLKNI